MGSESLCEFPDFSDRYSVERRDDGLWEVTNLVTGRLAALRERESDAKAWAITCRWPFDQRARMGAVDV